MLAGLLIISGSGVLFHKYIAILGDLPSAGVAKVALLVYPNDTPVCAKATTSSLPVPPLSKLTF